MKKLCSQYRTLYLQKQINQIIITMTQIYYFLCVQKTRTELTVCLCFELLLLSLSFLENLLNKTHFNPQHLVGPYTGQVRFVGLYRIYWCQHYVHRSDGHPSISGSTLIFYCLSEVWQGSDCSQVMNFKLFFLDSLASYNVLFGFYTQA